MSTAQVSTAAELLDALPVADEIEVDGALSGMPMISLRPGVTLRGGALQFGAKGIRLTTGNRLEAISILVPDHEVAIGNDTSVSDLGHLVLRNVRTRGQVLLVAEGAVRAGKVEVDGLAIASANLRGRTQRQHGFGVDAMQGAFTLWNRQPDPAVRITATLTQISAGFNIYDGNVDSARFASITTHGDGAVGIQVSRDLPALEIADSVTTFGSGGTSLVRGQQTQLRAAAISIQPGGRIGRLAVGGSLATHGDQVVTLDVAGSLGMLRVRHAITASGAASDAVHATGQVAGLDDVTITAAHGQAIVRHEAVVAGASESHPRDETAEPIG